MLMKSPCALCGTINGMGKLVTLCSMRVCWDESHARVARCDVWLIKSICHVPMGLCC